MMMATAIVPRAQTPIIKMSTTKVIMTKDTNINMVVRPRIMATMSMVMGAITTSLGTTTQMQPTHTNKMAGTTKVISNTATRMNTTMTSTMTRELQLLVSNPIMGKAAMGS